MKRLFILLFSVTLVAEENPYSPINKRNAFQLTEALPHSKEILDKIETPKPEDTLSITLSTKKINKILETISKHIDNYKNLRSYIIVELLYATGIRSTFA